MRLDRLIIFLFFVDLFVSGCQSSNNTANTLPTSSSASINITTKTSTALQLPTPRSTSLHESPNLKQAKTSPNFSSSKERGDSFSPSISANGRWVAFLSRANDLVEKSLTQCQSLNGRLEYCTNVFVYDNERGTINLVSVTNDGVPANGHSSDAKISADGNWIVYSSEATNLVQGKTSRDWAVYLYNRKMGNTELVRASGRGPTISGDGQYIAFESNGNIFLYDHQTGTAIIVGSESNFGQPGGDSLSPALSADGQWLAFWSWNGNLVAGDTEICSLGDVNHSCGDVFLYNRRTGTFSQVVVGAAFGLGMGEFNLSISENGLWLAYGDQIYNRQTQRKEPLCSVGKTRCGGFLSADGKKVVYWTGPNYFVYDRSTGKVNQVNIASDGKPGNGQYVDYIHSTEGVSFTPGFSISPDGRWVAFSSTDSNLVVDDNDLCNGLRFPPHHCYDVFIHDLDARRTYRISNPFRK